MRIALGADHAGFRYKQLVKEHLQELGHDVLDFGTFDETPVDYPLFIRPAVEAVASRQTDRAIVFSQSGNGAAIVANKSSGIRCVTCWSPEVTALSRQHNDSNVLSIGQKVVEPDLVIKIVDIWLTTPFEGGRHARRLAEIEPPNMPYPRHEKTLLIRPEFLNHSGNVFGGYMMKWADDMAYNAATLAFPSCSFVTKLFEQFNFKSPIVSGDVIKVISQVISVGNSSCKVDVWSVDARKNAEVFRTSAIMVNLKHGKSEPIPRDK
ncbi:MAG: RpiB/LacA/LacB family sugar-phosphate isomerase [Verrucomicrobiales bacterium]|jgi:ribose 5-phosphate isomerase B|nr:RpiB/LacA/LacB family sugar-phosphate isomerase [Verrucomicrobiales bacterium]